MTADPDPENSYTSADVKWLQMPVLRDRTSVIKCLGQACNSKVFSTVTGLYVDNTCALICAEELQCCDSLDIDEAVRTIIRTAAVNRADGIILASVLRGSDVLERVKLQQLALKVQTKCRAVGLELVDLVIVGGSEEAITGSGTNWGQAAQ